MKASPIRVLAGLCALQIAVLAGLWVAPDGRLRDTARWREPAGLQVDYAAMGPGLPAVGGDGPPSAESLLARPLFSVNRRPPQPAAAAQAEPAPDRLDLVRVRAIVEGPDAVSSAILDIDGRSRRILMHQAFEGWTLRSLDTQARTVTLARDGRTRVLALQRGQLSATNARSRPGGARTMPASPSPVAPASGGSPP
jgi:hypothetical protein